ncbi:MAG: hypothetical protein PHW10_02470 [Candidatus Peribacteraceae bacterium]|nr:hypothetical protein [Candidatus Peribacteraceae bacterium]
MTFLPLTVALAFSASPALAYISPEEVLMQQQQYFTTPTTTDNTLRPNKRRMEEIGRMQVEEREALHPNTVYDPNLEGSIPPPSLQSSSAGPTGPDHAAATADPAAATPPSQTVDPVMLRLLMRLERDRAPANTNAVIGQQARPLAPTGMETTAVLVAVLAAVGWTVLRAVKTRGWKPF